jgi:hypothetical protein
VPKVKAGFITAIQSALFGHSQDHASVSGNTLAFYTTPDGIVMRTKPKQPHHTTAAQAAQNELWKDADCMYTGMTYGQSALWWNYYVSERISGRTKRTKSNAVQRGNQQIPPKDIGKQSLFMSRAMKLDLLDYLQDYLQSEWNIRSVVDTGEAWEVTASLTNPSELTEAIVYVERLPVRGY